MLKKTVFVSAGYVDRNPNAQEDIFYVIDLLLEKIDLKLDGRELFVWDAFIFIFLKNRNLCEILKRPVLEKMGDLVLESKNMNPRLLDFFLTVVQPLKNENCILANQNASIEVLTSPNALLLHYPEDPSVEIEEIISSSRRGFAMFGGKNKAEEEEEERKR